MRPIVFCFALFLSLSGSLMAQGPVNRHEFRAGISRGFLTTGDERTPVFYNQYLLGLSPRWGIMSTVNFLHSGSFPTGNMLNQPDYPGALHLDEDYNIIDLEPQLAQKTMAWIDVAPQFRALIGERHQLGVSVGPSIGYFHYTDIAVLEIGTFVSPLGSRNIELVEYRHTRGIDVGGHGKLAYDLFLGEHASVGVQASANFFANGDFVYSLGVNAGIRL